MGFGTGTGTGKLKRNEKNCPGTGIAKEKVLLISKSTFLTYGKTW
jgi:hypothetical protein